MKLFYCCLLLLGAGVLAEERVKRQATYTFPGPRSDRGYRSGGSPVYVEEQDDGYQPSPNRRQFQGQPTQSQYAPTQARGSPQPAAAAPPAPAAPPVYEAAPRAAAPQPRQQSAPRRRASNSGSSNSGRANKYGSAPAQNLNDEVEEDVPDPLTLLLQDSQFVCQGKQDGYYADDSVNCQVFHYCVGGAKHSWMCPENTVFHQVHLNCVPDAQDICSQSQKFHFVNEYLYKPVDYEGPNNTARYSQRYYPDGYSVGDPIVSNQDQQARRPAQSPPQSYSAPAPRPPPRQVAPAPPPPPQPAYRAPPQSAPSYRQAPASRPASRPSRPIESYPVEVPEGYRQGAQPQSQPTPQAYRQPQTSAPRQPPPEAYNRPPVREPPASSSYSSEENLYQPQPQARRPAQAAVQARPTAGYAPAPREQYSRPSARSSGGGYQAYGSNQAAGVQYDEDY